MLEMSPMIMDRLAIVRRFAASIFGGRHSRSAWALDSILYLAVIALLLVAPSTFLWTSPQPLRELYMAYAIGAAALCGLGTVLSFAKRLHDQNLNGLWSIPVLIGLPWALFSAAQWWVTKLYEKQNIVSSDAYYGFAEAIFLIVVLVVALRPAKEAERFGPRYHPRDVLRPRHPSAFLTILALAVLVPTSIYAGFFQDGLWVRREQYSYYVSPAVGTLAGGTAFATCGNAKGVTATAQEGTDSQFVRDAIGGTWSIVVLPDGTLDIQTFSSQQILSYQDDGFSITGRGLRLGSYSSLARDVDHFMIVAEAPMTAGGVANVTVLNFVRRQTGFQVLISSSRILGKGGILTPTNPRASTFLMMADCSVNQELESDRDEPGG